jgi:hypothetical protein
MANEIHGFVNIGAPVVGENDFNTIAFPNIITGSGGSNSLLTNDANIFYKNDQIKSYTLNVLKSISTANNTLSTDIELFFKQADVKQTLLDYINVADPQNHYTNLKDFDTNFDTKWNSMKLQIQSTVTAYEANLQQDLRIVFQFVYTHQSVGSLSNFVAYKFKLIPDPVTQNP